MAIPSAEQRRLFARSGNRCAFSDCRRVLVTLAPSGDPVVLGEAAHIVAESPNGPRGVSTLSAVERNSYENLILLCNVHHQLIDDQDQLYTVERLRAVKQDHELWVEKTLGKGSPEPSGDIIPAQVEDVVYSTLLPVDQMPPFVYGSPCSLSREKEVVDQLAPLRGNEMAPFVLRAGMLFSFQDLRHSNGPFRHVVNEGVERFASDEWWKDPDKSKWFIDLTKRALNKLTGRRGLQLDREHNRFYFPCETAGAEREVRYTPLNQKRARRKVVWQPTSRRTGEGRGYWLHRAIALRFLLVDDSRWCLALRPELRVTADGVNDYPSEKIGARVTRRKSRAFNYDLLKELQFWRDYLSDSKPRIILNFGSRDQRIIASTSFMSCSVKWPGIPDKYKKPFKNVEYAENLFSLAELEQESEVDDWDEDGF